MRGAGWRRRRHHPLAAPQHLFEVRRAPPGAARRAALARAGAAAARLPLASSYQHVDRHRARREVEDLARAEECDAADGERRDDRVTPDRTEEAIEGCRA